MTQGETKVQHPEVVDNIPLSTKLEKDPSINGEAESDQTSNQVENITLGKDSPLSDITTSPAPFDLSLREVDGEIQSTIYNIEKLLEEQEKENEHENQEEPSSNSKVNDTMGSTVAEVLQEIEDEQAKDESKGNIHGDNVSDDVRNKDSYESSELSDLDENQSEAETDKMDFLDEIDNIHTDDIPQNGLSDLQALSQLTELARLKDVDSDFGDDEDEDDNEHREIFTNGNKLSTNGESRKRSSEVEDEDKLNESKPVPKKSKPAEDHIRLKQEKPDEKLVDTKENGKQEEDVIIIDDDNGAEADPEDEGDQENEDADDDDDDEEEEDEDKEEASVEKSKTTEKTSKDSHKEEADIEDDEEVEIEDDVDINEQRNLAIEELIAIEANFAEVRDKLYNDKLALLERELQLCLEGSHPELSKIYGKINGFYQDGLKLANSNLSYKLKCVDKETIATRTSIHQNFMRNLMDTKNTMITDTTSLWYKINKERNQLDQLVPDYNFSAIPAIPNVTIPAEDCLPNGYIENVADAPLPKRLLKQNTIIQLVQQRNSINEQLGILNGLVEFHGFPSAINSTFNEEDIDGSPHELLLRKATEEEINDDLRAMGIST
ncbi:DEP1 Transcriptional regulatory protein DEP1 [Candida maltosa Xu316]